MKPNKDKWMKIIGWILFIIAVGLFCLQMGYLLVHERHQIEYIDNRLFYIFNMICVISLLLAIVLLQRLKKKFLLISISIVIVFVGVQIALLINSNKEINNITSISPNFKHVFSIKKNTTHWQADYYRSYYGILARPKEKLPNTLVGEYKVEWLANDIVAFTYESANNTIQQFIGTYGDRKNGLSYYYVAAEIQGVWEGNNVEVVSSSEGITVMENGEKEVFDWDSVHQFGTLVVVLKKDNEAIWTISLNENFVVHSDSSKPTVGNISLYKATMDENEPLTLQYISSN